MKEFVIWYGKERADLPDMEDATGYLPLLEHMRLHRVFTKAEGRAAAGSTTTFEARIFDGFNLTDRSGQTIVLHRGSGVFPLLHNGQLYFGLVAGEEGQESQTLDFTAKSDATYGIWVRFAYSAATEENRVFWDQVGAAEEVSMLATRNQLIWEYQIVNVTAADPSGGDWVKIGTVTKSTTLTAQTDLRQLYFEGYAGSGADQWAHEWGDGSNERSPTRGTYGVADLHQWVQAVRRQLHDLVGQGGWYKASGDNSVQYVKPAVSSPPSPSPIWDSGFRWYNQRGEEVMRYTKMGRLARHARHQDDFNYHGSYWGSAAGTTAPHYGYVATGSGANITSSSGSVMIVSGDGSSNYALLTTHPLFQFRISGPTSLRMAGFYANIIYPPAQADFCIQIGFFNSGVPIVWWELDTDVDAYWHLKANDTLGGTFDVTSLAASGADTHLEFAVDPFYNSNVGIVMGSLDVNGSVDSPAWPGTTLPGAGATFLGTYAMCAQIINRGSSNKYLYMDFWEGWQEGIHAGYDA